MKLPEPIHIKELAQQVGATEIIGTIDTIATGINEIHKVSKGDITFVDVEKYFTKALLSAASIILINKAVAAPAGKTLLVCEAPFEAYNRLVKKYRPFRAMSELISPSANIHPSAIIEPNVVIGANVQIGKHSYIQANVTIRDHVKIGDYVVIQSGSVIGSDAFYYHKKNSAYQKWPSGGQVLIENHVDIGPCCTICKGVSGDTVIGMGTKLDAQVHIGHGVVLGEHCLVAAQVGISGKTVIGNEVTLYGQVGIAPRLTIVDKAVVLAKSGVTKSLKKATSYFGYPAREASVQYKSLALLNRLPSLLKKIKNLCLVGLFIGGLSACGPTEIKLTRADKKNIDTLTTNAILSMEPLLDSLCLHQKDSILEVALDSILEERRIKEERLRRGN